MTGWRRWLAAVGGLALTGVLAAVLGLPAIGRFLVVSDARAAADALYVFPGEVPRRARCGAELFRQHLAPSVVLTGARISPLLEAVGMPLSDAEVNARLLTRLGVPGEALTVLNEGTSTEEDAQALRRWATAKGGIRSVVAVTSPTHSRRARRTLRRVFADSGIEVRLQACPAVLPDGWWRDEETMLQVTNEYLKLLYYTLAY